ncbi:MAG TPA: tetratricopeptide repeat protein [Pyrinomonadaceae bacterium]|nr:tetratricopeptide repeat protein [Pyrinomonadaceae bacterium]
MCRVRLLLLPVIISCLISQAAAAQARHQQEPATAEVYVAEGDRHARERAYDKAVEAYREALRLKPDSASAHHGLGRAYVSMGRAGDALEPLRAAARLDPQNAAVRLNLGITLASLRRADEALVEMNEAKRLAPRDPRVHNELGNLLHNSFGRMEEALAAYHEALRLNPNVPAVHHNIGLMLMRLGRFSEAVGPLEEALRLSPAYLNARYHLSNAYSRLGRYAEAADSWTKFLELAPDGKEALNSRAWNYAYLGGRGREAAADARSFLRIAGWRDEGSQFMVLLAHLGYRQAGQDAEARAVLEECVKRCDKNAWPYPVIRHALGELSGEELLAVADSNDKKTEARTYAGMKLLLEGKGAEARAHFAWVKEYGNKRFFEYPLAVAELGRLAN